MIVENVDVILKMPELPPVLFLYGEEEFLLEESLNHIISTLTEKNPDKYDVEHHSADEISIENLVDICSAYPFIAEKRVIVAKNFNSYFSGRVSKNTEEKSRFAKYLLSPQTTTFLILAGNVETLNGLSNNLKNPKNKAKADKILASAKFPYKVLLDKYPSIEFPKVYESDFSSWIVRRVKAKGREIAPDAAELIVGQVQPDLRELSNELDKLMIFTQDRKKITADDVHFCVGSSRVYNVFELQKSVGKKRLAMSIEIIENMLAQERQEMLIISMLTKYFATLWKISDERTKTQNNFQLAGIVGVNAFFLQDYFDALRVYSVDQLDNAFLALAIADEELKSSSTNSLYILEKMFISIMG